MPFPYCGIKVIINWIVNPITTMKHKKEETAIANKIKKWLQTAEETKADIYGFGINITRLTSIKSLCQNDLIAAEKFALFIIQRVYEKMNEMTRPEYFSVEDWRDDKQLISEGINLMENYLQNSEPEIQQKMRSLLKEINNRQGDNIRRVHWNTIHFVRSGYLLKLEYALRCFIDRDFTYWVYKLTADYVAEMDGIKTKSVPRLLEVAEFWCKYYFGQTLTEKFPNFTFTEMSKEG